MGEDNCAEVAYAPWACVLEHGKLEFGYKVAVYHRLRE